MDTIKKDSSAIPLWGWAAVGMGVALGLTAWALIKRQPEREPSLEDLFGTCERDCEFLERTLGCDRWAC